MIFSDDIVNMVFTKAIRGYDVQEVDLFLDEVIRTLEEHEQERDTLLSRIEALLEELDRADNALIKERSRLSAGEAAQVSPGVPDRVQGNAD